MDEHELALPSLVEVNFMNIALFSGLSDDNGVLRMSSAEEVDSLSDWETQCLRLLVRNGVRRVAAEVMAVDNDGGLSRVGGYYEDSGRGEAVLY